MATPTPTTDVAKTMRRQSRAKRACKVCNARRVRCNVVETFPCDNCRTASVACEIVPSRRGKRPASRVLSQRHDEPSHIGHENLQLLASSPDAHAVNAIKSPETNHPSPIASVNTTRTQSSQATNQVLFFGESNLLNVVGSSGSESPMPNLQRTKQNRMRYPISDAINIRASEFLAEHSLPASSHKAQYLAQEGAFTLPAPRDRLDVLRAYFQWFHPCFPVVDRLEVATQHNKGVMSPLLLQAILFIGASYCEDATVLRMGFKDRPDAKRQFYQRAKILFDADWESNEVTVLQALFLISFWRAQPLNVKNSRYWLGAAISLAQARGFHRSSHLLTMGVKESRLRKRIWWSIYVRDRQSSASLGLPSRIQDDDCDIDMLSYADLDKENDVETSDFLSPYEHDHGVYAIQMARLAQLLGRIIKNQFRPSGDHPDNDERLKLIDALEEWRNMLPANMKSCGIDNRSENIWTYLLHLAYNYLQILLHRHAYTQPQIDCHNSDGGTALQAACRVTRIVEDMLSQKLIQFGQMHSITSIFSSLCIHTIELQRSEGISKKLAEHRAQICLLGLKEIQKYWEVNNLVLDLFFQHVDDSTARRLRGGVAEDLPDVQFPNRNQEPTASRYATPRTASADNPSAFSFTGLGAPEIGATQSTDAIAERDSVIFNMPRNILSQGGSADDFNLFLDQYMLSNEDNFLSDGQFTQDM